MSDSYHTTRRVEWVDTDAAGIIHFASFFRYMEAVEHEMLRARGLSVSVRQQDVLISWPRVSARCEFRGAVRFEDVLDIGVRVTRVGEKSITYQFDFKHEGRDVAEGEITAVCCRILDGQQPHSIPVPQWFVEKLPAVDKG